jgi:type II secretory pathway component GspD/PulD (secretin)
MTASRATAAAVTGLVWILGGCAAPTERALSSIFTGAVAYEEPRQDYRLDREVQRYRYPDLDHPDGTISRLLWTEPGQARAIIDLVKDQPSIKALDRIAVNPSLLNILDPDEKDPEKARPTNEAILLVGAKETVDAATDLVNFVVTSPPLIEIEARIVEVQESDESGFGVDFFLHNRRNPFDKNNPTGPLDPNDAFIDRGRTTKGLPVLPGASSGNLPASSILELGTIAGNFQLDFVVQALKVFSKADVLSAPRVAVVNGFRSVFRAEQQIPIFQQTVVGNSVTITTTYKPVGISLDVTPRLISRDVIRMTVDTKVESITGAVSLPQGSAQVVTPIISSRSAKTFVDVHDGAAVVIGGLLSTSRAYSEDKVPVLGDIPLLDVFFKSYRASEGRSNLLFFIRPRVIASSGDAGASVILPPAESKPTDK